MTTGALAAKVDAAGGVDLHVHSTASDGALSPAEIVAEAARLRLTALALTDHDTTSGLAEAEAAARRLAVRLVPGIELSCDEADAAGYDRMEVLGYFFDRADSGLSGHLAKMKSAREDRARDMVERLRRLGAGITWESVRTAAAGGAVGRPHVARALVQCGFVGTVSEAFGLYLGSGRPAYVPHGPVSPGEACRLVRSAGGVPVLAHPVRPGAPRARPTGLAVSLAGLVEAGLGGLECHYPGYGRRTRRWLLALAEHFALVPTGGSDYHGPGRPGHELGCVDVPEETVELLERAASGGRPIG